MSLSPPRAEPGAELDLGNQHIHWQQQPDGCRARGGGWLIGHGMGSGAARAGIDKRERDRMIEWDPCPKAYPAAP